MANHAVNAFLNDPDPDARRAELLAFIGPRPEGFLDLYNYLVRNQSKDTTARVGRGLVYNGFSAYAFFFGPVYFFYRKMWLWGAGYVVAMLAFAAYPMTSRADIGLGVGMAFVTRWVYVRHAIGRITALRTSATEDRQAFLNTLAEAGGISKTAAWISGVLFTMAVALAVMETFF